MDYLFEDFEQIRTDVSIDWKSIQNSTIFITGATGLVGSMLIKSLLHCNKTQNSNIRILALVRNCDKARAVFGDMYDDKNISFILGDVMKVIKIPEQIDYIIHGASITESKLMVEKPVETLATAIVGTENILKLAIENKVKSMIYISSMEVYGITDTAKSIITEKDLGYIDILNVRSSYSEGKRICECLCAAYQSEYGVPVKIARLAQTFGAGVDKNDNRVFAQFAKSAIQNKNIILHTNGESFGNYCYTADVICGLLCILTKGINAEAYTIVNEETTMQIKDMAQMVAKDIAAGNIDVIFDIPKNPATMGYAPNSTMHLSSEKLRSLGWKPKYDLTQMYNRMIAAWQLKRGK